VKLLSLAWSKSVFLGYCNAQHNHSYSQAESFLKSVCT